MCQGAGRENRQKGAAWALSDHGDDPLQILTQGPLRPGVRAAAEATSGTRTRRWRDTG